MREKYKLSYEYYSFDMANTTFVIDYEDLDYLNALKTENYSILFYKYMESGNKEMAITTLIEQRKSKNFIAISIEIINTFIYFEDYLGALNFIKYNESTNNLVRPIENLIKISMCLDQENEVFNLCKNALESKYDRRIIKFLILYYNDKKLDSLRVKLSIIQEIIEKKYIDELSYTEYEYLYKNMPKKDIFLLKMIKINPLIKKRYYLRYAQIYGFIKEDIINIILAKYRKWAMKIALYHGWIEESMRLSIEKYYYADLYCVGMDNDNNWQQNDDSHCRFHR